MIGDAAKSASFVIKVDGAPTTFDPSKLTSEIELELYRESGLTFTTIMRMLESGDVPLMAVVALVFMARRCEGERVDFHELARSISYGSIIDIESADGGGGDEGPLLHAAS